MVYNLEKGCKLTICMYIFLKWVGSNANYCVSKQPQPHGKMNGWVPWPSESQGNALNDMHGSQKSMAARSSFQGMDGNRDVSWMTFQHIISLENRVFHHFHPLKTGCLGFQVAITGTTCFSWVESFGGGKVTKEKQHKRMIEVAQSFQGCDQTCLDLFEVIFHGFLTIVCHH